MNTLPSKAFTVSLAAVVALCSGCVGSGPNTERGAVGGALAGAVVGGVVGNNHGSHNVASGAAIGAAAGGLAGAALGNAADHERGTVYGGGTAYDTNPRQPVYAQQPPQQAYPQQPQVVYSQPQTVQAPQQVVVQSPQPAQYEQRAQVEYVVVQPPPPPPREYVTVRPGREAVWVPGFYSYAGRGYAWVPGHWEVPPRGYHTYIEPRWERRPQGYVYVRGYWR
jgi:hypothetical protein